MEPREPEKLLESSGEGQTSPPRPEERKRRFRIVKLEDRIARNGGGRADTLRGKKCSYFC
jgi:hypothetical protein